MKSNLTYIKKPELFEELSQFQDDFFAVIDLKVKNHLPEWIQKSPHVFWIQDPEKEKTLEKHAEAMGFFLDQGISRQSKLIGIGGGATTDLAGFVAATILRGISWIAVPTSLLGMVDAAIGGKVGVNMPHGKNLVGSFHTPTMTFICHDFLSTLSKLEIESGKGEILKYGFLSKTIFESILKKENLETIIKECALFKQRLVEEDYKEDGDRVLLNLGHTMGHAFESTLKISHGMAVVMGIKYLHKMFNHKDRLVDLEKMVIALNLPQDELSLSRYTHFPLNDFKNYILQDKKKNRQNIRLVLIKDIGSCYTYELSLQEFMAKIEAYEDFKR